MLLSLLSPGLFAGLSLEGTVIVERRNTNREFYGQAIPAKDLLAGKVPPPEAASALYEVVEAAEGIDETGVPQQAYTPAPPPGAAAGPGAAAATGAYDLGGSAAGTQDASKRTSAGGPGPAPGNEKTTVFDADQA